MFGAKSQSGQGLSINTSSANALPASTPQSRPSTTLFGTSLNTTQPQQNSTLFGGPTPSVQPAGGLFQSQSTQPQRSSIFGTIADQQTQPQSLGAGLFGSGITQQAQPQQNGGFFSSLGQNQSQGQSQQPHDNGMGQSSLNKPSFLNQATSFQPQASNPQPSSIFATSIGQYSQQYQTVPGVRISVNELRPITRFNDLHEELQKKIEEVDNFILGQVKYQRECQAVMEKVTQTSSPVPTDVDYCGTTLETLQIALESDAEAIAHAKTMITADAANAKLSFDVIEALKMPQQFHHFSLWQGQNLSHLVDSTFSSPDAAAPSKNLVSYFSQSTGNMSQILSKYKANLADVETCLQSLEVNLGHQVQQMASARGKDGGVKKSEDQIRELAAVLREFETGILGVASKVGNSREKVQELTLGDFASRSRARRA